MPTTSCGIDYHNEGVSDIVRKVYEKNKILEYDHQLVQHYDPIYYDPFVGNIFTLTDPFLFARKAIPRKTL